jgi:hypothetical protein
VLLLFFEFLASDCSLRLQAQGFSLERTYQQLSSHVNVEDGFFKKKKKKEKVSLQQPQESQKEKENHLIVFNNFIRSQYFI